MLRYRAAAVAAGVLWSLGGVLIKILSSSSGGGLSAWGITCYRSLIAGLVLLPLALRAGRPPLRETGVAIALYAALLGFYVASTQMTTAANAIFLQYTAPLYALILGPLLFREPRRPADAGAVGVAMIGVAVLILGNWRGVEAGGLLLGLASGALFGLFMLWLRRLREEDPAAVTAWNNLGVALLSAVILLALKPDDLMLPVRALQGVGSWTPLGLLLVMGVLQIAVPYVLFSYALQRIPAVEAGLLALVEPLLNPIWVVLMVGERPSPATLAGGALILGAILLRYTLFGARRSGAEAAAV